MIDAQLLRKRVIETKRRTPHALVFLHIGDFYEAIDEDARVIARTLHKRLNRRSDGPVFCGIPYHAIDQAKASLESAGYRIAIASTL